MKKTIAEHMKDILIEKERDAVSYGDLNEIHECAERSGMKDRNKSTYGSHPLNIINKVLNALERSDLFKKRYIKFFGRHARCFVLKENERWIWGEQLQEQVIVDV